MFLKTITRWFSREEFTGPGAYNELMRIAYPLILMSASNVVMQFADRKFLGNSSTAEMAAAMPSGILFYTLFCFFLVSANFTSAIVAQLFGTGARRDCVRAAWSGFYFSLFSSGFIAIVVPFLGYLILKLSLSATLFPHAWTYFYTIVPSGIFACLSAPLFAFYSGRGKTFPVALINIGICLANIILDWVLIFGKFGLPRMGIFGAGIATSLSAMGGFLAILTLYLSIDQKVYPTRSLRRFQFEYIRKLLRYGTPAGLQVLSDVGSFTLILLIVGRLGEVALAATTIAFSINNLSFLPLLGISDGTAIICGQYIGRKMKKIASRVPFRAWRLAFVYMLLTGIFYVTSPDYIISVFKPDNPDGSIDFAEVAEQGRLVLLLAAFWNLCDTMKFVFGGGLRGAGDTRAILLINTFCAWVLAVPGICLMVFVLQPSILTVWGYMVFVTATEGLLTLWRYRTGKWRSIRMVNPLGDSAGV